MFHNCYPLHRSGPSRIRSHPLNILLELSSYQGPHSWSARDIRSGLRSRWLEWHRKDSDIRRERCSEPRRDRPELSGRQIRWQVRLDKDSSARSTGSRLLATSPDSLAQQRHNRSHHKGYWQRLEHRIAWRACSHWTECRHKLGRHRLRDLDRRRSWAPDSDRHRREHQPSTRRGHR